MLFNLKEVFMSIKILLVSLLIPFSLQASPQKGDDSVSLPSPLVTSEGSFNPTLMSFQRAVELVTEIDRKHNILPSEDAFAEFVPYFMQMERDFVNNVNAYEKMRQCGPMIGSINYSPSIEDRFETIVSAMGIDDKCHYMSVTKGSADVSVCTFTIEEMNAVADEGVTLYKRAHENITIGVHTDIMRGQPLFAELLSPDNCRIEATK